MTKPIFELDSPNSFIGTAHVQVQTVADITGENEILLQNEHAFAVSQGTGATVPTSLNEGRAHDIEWAPKTIGYLPPAFRVRSLYRQPIRATFVRISDAVFRAAALGVVDFEQVDSQFLHGITDPVAFNLMEALSWAASGGSDTSEMMLESIGIALSVRMMQKLGAVMLEKVAPYSSGLPINTMRRITEYIDDNIANTIRLKELAGIADLSPFHFARAFHKTAKITPARYIVLRRVECAKQRMRIPYAQLAIIAYECGFASQSHFTTAFKRVTGMTPAAYRGQFMT